MKKPRKVVVISWIIFLFSLAGIAAWIYYAPSPPIQREVVAMQLTEPGSGEVKNLLATQVPEFDVDISDPRFEDIQKADKETLKKAVETSLVRQSDFKANVVETELSVDRLAKKLTVKPNISSSFKPGKYKFHLTLRTSKEEINLEQDFTWGVIAVNTNKSIYRPGETAKIGFGILNDNGETHCMTGKDTADVWATITAPDGTKTEISTKDGTIKDSGECGSITVTNKADFQSEYKTAGNGTYYIDVTASIKDGPTRSIRDFFTVDEAVSFDVERHDFPTRIYPGSPYPVTFKVKTKEAYKGTIEEIIPEDFEIAGINNDGTVVEKENYKTIVWNIDMQPDKEYFFSYIIRFPMVSPEFYLLGPITIGNFKEARQWQIASDAINSTTGIVSYEDNGASATWYRVWNGSSFGSQVNMATSGDTPDDSRWFVEKSSPKTGEKLVAALDICGAPINTECIWMYRWTGSAWIQDFTVNVNTPNADTRFMDIAYEEESGDALFVWGDNTNQLKYRLRESGSWSGTQNAGTGMDSRKKWVKAKGQFNSNNILVGYLNDNERIGALIWDGTTDTFINQFDDDDSPAQTETVTSDEQAFDIAWETQSNTPMIFWGTAANTVLAREFTGGSWSSEITVYNSGFAGDVEWISAAADPIPSSNLIALALQESDGDTTEEASDCEFGIWNGSAGVTRPTAVVCRSDYDGRLNDVAFENTGSRAVWFYAAREGGSGVNANTPSYRTWTSGGGFTASTLLTGDLSGNIESVQLHSDLNTTSMIALTADAAGDLNHFEWDGTSWTGVTTDLHSNIQNTNENAEAYGFGFDRNLETLAAYRWFFNSGTVAVTTAMGAENSPSTLTEANQQFRLRLLLYYPDSLPINGRQYRLQYVSPGTGSCDAPSGGTPATWTDVGTSSSDPISFYNNPTPADGNNLTGNASLDPTYGLYDPSDTSYIEQDYEEANPFTNSVSAMTGDQVALWDFSLVDNTLYDRESQTFCFRVVRDGSNLVLKINQYPQISTFAEADVRIQGGSRIQGGTRLQ